MFEFQLWSKRRKSVNDIIRPRFSLLRDFDDLNTEEKRLIWAHLHEEFGFPKSESMTDFDDIKYPLKSWSEISAKTVFNLNYSAQLRTFGKNLLRDKTSTAALRDFKEIFLQESQDVVLELLSIFASFVIELSKKNARNIYKEENEKESEFQKRRVNNDFKIFDDFAEEINYTFSQFGINLKLTRIGFLNRQEKVIEQEVIEPVIGVLSNAKFEKVNRDLHSALKDFRENKYAESITKFIAAFEEYIQICIGDNTKMFSNGIKEGVRAGVFPDDSFTKQIFSNTDSILTQMRKKYGVAHSPDDVPTQKDAQIVMNLIFVFIQHCS